MACTHVRRFLDNVQLGRLRKAVAIVVDFRLYNCVGRLRPDAAKRARGLICTCEIGT